MTDSRRNGRMAGPVLFALVLSLLVPAHGAGAGGSNDYGRPLRRRHRAAVADRRDQLHPRPGCRAARYRHQDAPAAPARQPNRGYLPAAVLPVCTGDGTTGPRVQLVYARPAGTPDRYDAYAASFQTWAAQIDAGVKESAEQTGGTRRIRYVHDASCIPTISRLVLTAPTANDFGVFASEVREAHNGRTDRRFLVWMEAASFCGLAEFGVDDRPDWRNENNTGPSRVGRVDTGCWGIPGALAEGHELFHTLGAVQYSAPNSTGFGHCLDEIDRMCGGDSSGKPVFMRCPDGREDLFDCNHDDYFHTHPPAGSYLATHWNTADSRFLTAPPAAPGDIVAVSTEDSATVRWTTPPETTGVEVTTVVDGVPGPPEVLPAGATSYTPPSLPAGASVAFSVAARNEYGLGRWSAPTPPVVPGDGARFHALTPARILDTRTGNGAPTALVPSGATLDVAVVGRGGVPATGASAVVLNVTVTEPRAGGHLTVWPTGEPRPLASNLNVSERQTVANLVTVKTGAGGKVSLYNGAGTGHLIADVAGWYGASSGADGSRFHSQAPARILDTRAGNGAPVSWVTTAAPIDLQVTGRGGVPATGVSAVVLNVTVTEPMAGGFLTVWPAGEARPLASNLNFEPFRTVPNLVTVKVGAGGKVSLYHSGYAAHLVADVAGWFGPGGESAGARYHPLVPARLVDTRIPALFFPPTNVFFHPNVVGAGATLDLQVAGQGGVPAAGASAVILNVTAVNPAGIGYLTVWPTGQVRPLASNLNFLTGGTVPNLVVAKLGADGKVSIYNGSESTVHLIADVAGWYGAE